MITPDVAKRLLQLPHTTDSVLLQSVSKTSTVPEVKAPAKSYRREKAIIPYVNPSQERPAIGAITSIEGVECVVVAVREETYNIILEAWVESDPISNPASDHQSQAA